MKKISADSPRIAFYLWRSGIFFYPIRSVKRANCFFEIEIFAYRFSVSKFERCVKFIVRCKSSLKTVEYACRRRLENVRMIVLHV